MPRLVDGDNLLGTWRGHRRSDAERREVARKIFRLSTRERQRIVVVFDGTPPPIPSPSSDVHYSGRGRKADDWILAFLREQSQPREWTVVTNDRSLGDQCRYLGARVERCESFRQRLARRSDGEKPEGPVDVDEWLEFFGDRGAEPGDGDS